MVQVIIIEKSGELNEMKIKDFSYDTLYKKCKFKKEEGFDQKAIWKSVKISNGTIWTIKLYARDFGKTNSENKYDLPPPVDNTLFFGAAILIAINAENEPHDLSITVWKQIYEKLFGGFFNLADTAQEDEDEEDELADLPSEMKTKDGYLKDSFIVDDTGSSVTNSSNVSDAETDETDYESELDFEDYEHLDSDESDNFESE